MAKLKMALVVWFGLCAPTVAIADPITFREDVSGDLPQQLPTENVLGLRIGLNTVSGSIRFVGDDSDFDSFAFAVPNGAQLAQIRYSFTVATTPDQRSGDVSYVLHRDNTFYTTGETLGRETINVLGNTELTLFSPALPLGAGIYGMSATSMGRGLEGFGWVADYTWSLQVEQGGLAPIPEPGSLLLLCSGAIASLAARRWRQHGHGAPAGELKSPTPPAQGLDLGTGRLM
jgi:hypothetical protein